MSDPILVSTEWLATHLDDSDLCIIDVRGHVLPPTEPPPHYFNHQPDYDESHIPGAVFVDWVHEITDPAFPKQSRVAPPERYAAVMARLGVDETKFVVAYDDYGNMLAARLWWTLNYYGHTRVAVLDGGWGRWTAEKRPVTADIPRIQPTTFTPHVTSTLRRTGEQVLAALGVEQTLIDARSVGEFNGQASRAERFGRIPSSLNLPRQALLNEDGRLLTAGDLRDKFAAIGVDETTKDVVFYCNGGVSASFDLLAMRAAGLPGGSVYDASWKEWGNDPEKPIAK
ncbi:MAG: sulfurtransferase [Chloroflexota bacterium]|nr:sulfurtransferase [Chloroflexota bacterium]